MRFLSFNIRYDNPADGPDAWPHRAAAVAELIARLRPDAFGLQEALRHQVDQLARALHEVHALDYDWRGVGRDDGGASGEHNPVFFRPSALTLHDSGTFWLSDTPDSPGSCLPGAAFPRICTWAKLQADGDKPFFFFNTHFDYTTEAVRTASADRILGQIPSIAGLYPSVLLGDLNSAPGSTTWHRLAKSFFADTREAARALPEDRRPHADVGTFTGFRDAATAGRVLPGEDTIDAVFLSGFALRRFEVRLDVRPDNGRCLSDHRAIQVDATIGHGGDGP